MTSITPTNQKSVRETAVKKPEVKAPVMREAITPDAADMADMQRTVAAPRAARPFDILGLQRQYGNNAVQRMLAKHNIQAKLTVGAANDAYEQEADRVAAQVMSMPDATPKVQRMGADEEEEMQAKPLAETVTLLAQTTENPLGGFEASSNIESRLAARNGKGNPLSGEVRAFMEPRFGTDLSGVRIHADSETARLNQELNAQAFTHGQDIYVGENKGSFGSYEDKHLLAHELTHVIQQGAAENKGAQPITSLQPVRQSLQRVRGRRKDPLLSKFKEQNIKLSLFLSGLIPLKDLGLEYISAELEEALIKKGLATKEEIDEYNAHAPGDSSASSSSAAAAPAASSNAAVSAASVG